MRSHNYRLRQLANIAQFDEETFEQLYRAINTKRLIGFLGSGVSAAYGAMSWGEFVERVRMEALVRLREAKDLPRPEFRGDIEALLSQIDSITNDQAKNSESTMVLLEFYRLAFELAEHAHSSAGLRSSRASKSFHQYIASLFLSDRKHAEDLLLGRLWRFADATVLVDLEGGKDELLKSGKDNLLKHIVERMPRGIGLDLNKVYSRSMLKHLADSIHLVDEPDQEKKRALFADQKKEVLEFLNKMNSGSPFGQSKPTNYFPVDRRSAVSIAFPICGVFIGTYASKALKGKIWDELLHFLSHECEFIPDEGPKRTAADIQSTSTAGDLRPADDPLAALHRDLGIWRYLTTNYDREIERLLEHLNHARGTLLERGDILPPDLPIFQRNGTSVSSRGYLGEKSTSDALSRRSISTLINMASSENRAGAQIFHLHGRADHPETIVASEGDYQSTYLADPAGTADLRIAQDVVFSGNPVLFVGLGLQEQDLQRPLREFVSQNRRVGRDLFALMPASHGKEELLVRKVENYLRYGVRTIFYGEPELPPKTIGKDHTIGRLSISLEDRCIKIAQLLKEAQGARDGIDKQGEEPRRRGLFESLSENWRQAKDILFADGLLGQDNLDPFVWEACADLFAAVARAKRAEVDVPHIATTETVNAAIDYLKQLQDRILSAALVKAIDELAERRATWWQNVFDNPETRQTSKLVTIQARRGSLKTYTRHPLVLSGDIQEGATNAANVLIDALDCEGADQLGCRFILCESEVGTGKASHFFAIEREIIQRTVRQNFENNEIDPGENSSKHPYTHALFLNLGHSLEFSSSVIAVGNLLKLLYLDNYILIEKKSKRKKENKYISPDKYESYLYQHEEERLDRIRKEVGYLGFVEFILEELREKQSTHLRALLLIGGFDRLVTGLGKYRSQEVRSFVQLLARSAGVGIPLDTVIISRNVSQYPRVFEQEFDFSASAESRGLSDFLNEKKTAFKRAEYKVPKKNQKVKVSFFIPQHDSIPQKPLKIDDLHGDYTDLLRGDRRHPWADPRPMILKLPRINHQHIEEKGPWASPAWVQLSKRLSSAFYLWTIVEGAYRKLAITDDDPVNAERWATSLFQAIDTASEEGRGQRVIEAVLSVYGLAAQRNWEETLDLNSRIDFMVLQHLTYFGYPVPGMVLLRTPIIRRYLTHLALDKRRKDQTANGPEPGHEDDNDEPAIPEVEYSELIDVLEGSIARLIQNSLISVLDDNYCDQYVTHDDDSDQPFWLRAAIRPSKTGNQISAELLASVKSGCRYALHPRMRRYILKNTSVSTPVDEHTNTFVFTLHAMQPTDVCLLSPDYQRTVDDLVGELTQAWRTYDLKKPGDPTDEAEIENLKIKISSQLKLRDKASQKGYFWRARNVDGTLARASADLPGCFRAAYGVLRQMRPFSVLARMSSDDIYGPQDRSVYEHTDERLRDLIRGIKSAQEARRLVIDLLGAPIEDIEHTINTFGPTREPAEALYPHELSWLWNERGVIALAQGRLYDALPYFANAKKLLKRHEGELGRSTTIRLDINLAAGFLERGKLRAAVDIFRESEEKLESLFVRTSPKNMMNDFLNTLPLCIGYRGLERHLAGDRVRAKELYDNAIDRLRNLQRSRAISVFLKHRADLAIQSDDVDGARRDLADARQAAEGLKQLDILHAVYLSEAKFEMSQHSSIPSKSIEIIDAKIQSAKRYGAEMGLYSLLSDALCLEAQYRFSNKDFTNARDAAAEALSLASKHGMSLRRLASKLMLGRTLRQLGNWEAGDELIQSASAAAQQIGYNRLVRGAHEAITDGK